MHAFDGSKGARPTGELLLAQDGLLYGSTATGGTSTEGTTTTFGTLFSIARDGAGFKSLASFEGRDGSTPTGKMLQLDASTFVGLAAGGGKCGQGVIYNFSLAGNEVKGVTNCGQRRNSGSGSAGPLLLLLLGSLALRRRRR
jgi:MYXO-CTERM domain-containing protein